MAHPETATITSFGGYLRFLRRRARLTQTELSIAVGYSPGQISMLENGQRTPNITAIAALFVPALGIEHDAERREHLLALAATGSAPTREVVAEAALIARQEIGQLEPIPHVPEYVVARPILAEQLRLRLEHARQLALCGMGGMGKTTLAAQLASACGGCGVFWMTCSAATTLAPEFLLRQLAVFASTRIEQPQRLLPLLDQPTAGSPTPAFAQQLALVVAALDELTAPLLIFDDAQALNALPAVGALLEQLIARLPACQMLFVTRAELGFGRIAHLDVGGLERAEFALLCERLTGASPSHVAQVYEQTDGSPMLARLALQYWEQHGGGQRDGQPFPIASYLIESILNDLQPDARRLLDLLAVWRGTLNLTTAAVAEQLSARWPAHNHQAGLIALQRSRLIEQVAAAAPHPLLREPLLIAINAQPTYSHQLHQAAAALALQLDDPIRAIQHLIHASDFDAACALMLRQPSEYLPPGQATLMASVLDELLAALRGPQYARSHLQAQTFDLLILRGDLLAQSTRLDDAQSSYYAALNMATQPIDQARLGEKIALCAYRRGAFEEALTLCDHAVAALGGSNSADAFSHLMQIQSTRIRILITLARVDEARQLCEAALAQVAPLALAQPLVAGTIKSYANLTLGYLARMQGDNPQAHYHLHKCIQQSRAIGAKGVTADALQYLSVTLRDMGDMAGAEAAGDQALELAHAAGNEYLMSNILHHLSLSDYYHADLERALWRTQRVLQLKIPMGDIDGIVASRMVQAITLVACGDIDGASAAARQAGRDCDLLENTWLRGIADFGHAIALSVSADLAGAERCLLRALATPLLSRDVPFYTGTQMYLALVYVAQGRLDAAAELIDPPPPAGAGHSTALLRELVRGMWLLGHGRAAAAQRCAEQLIAQANQTQFLIYAQEGARLAALIASPPPLAELPRRICCPT